MQYEMQCDLVQRYQMLSERIQEMQEELVSANIASSFVEKNTEQHNTAAQGVFACRTALLSLLALRVRCILLLEDNGHSSYRKQYSDDIDEIIELIEKVEVAWGGPVDSQSDAADILAAVSPEHKSQIMSQLFPKRLLRRKTQRAVDLVLYRLLMSVANHYEHDEEHDAAIRVWDYMIQAGKLRNPEGQARELIVMLLGEIVEIVPAYVAEVADRECDLFSSSCDDATGTFFWTGGHANLILANFLRSEEFFDKCYAMRKKLYGPDDWYTACAEIHLALTRIALNKRLLADENEALLRFVSNVENGNYAGQAQQLYIDLFEAKALIGLFQIRSYANCSYEEDPWLLSVYERLCNRNDAVTPDNLQTFFMVRRLKNEWGAYYLRTGDFLQAEQAFRDALAAPTSDAFEQILSEVEIKSNLLMLFHAGNDLDKGLDLFVELMDYITDDNADVADKLTFRILALGNFFFQNPWLDDDDLLQSVKELYHDCLEDYLSDALNIDGCYFEFAHYAVGAILLLNSKNAMEWDEYRASLKLLQKLLDADGYALLNKGMKLSLHIALLAVSFELDEGELLSRYRQCLSYADDVEIPLQIRSEAYRFGAVLYSLAGDTDTGIRYAEQALMELTAWWRKYTRYINDARLIQTLQTCQLVFDACYAVLRQHQEQSRVYESVLRFKGLASLAGRERNRVLHSGFADHDLLKKIQEAQNNLAALETGALFTNSDQRYTLEYERLGELEVAFAREFPAQVAYTDITLSAVQNAMPDNATVIEFYVCAADYGKKNREVYQTEEPAAAIDVFIMRKRAGECSLTTLHLPDGERICTCAEAFSASLRDEFTDSVTLDQMEGKELLRKELYQKLIEPIMPFVDEGQTLYIAPDVDLMNLPFELLYDQDMPERELERITYVESARDFLFDNLGYPAEKSSLIIGNPMYKLRERAITSEEPEIDSSETTRDIGLDLNAIPPLPFSDIEARRVAKACGSRYYCGENARKSLVQQASGYQNIHIATHGFFDLQHETDTMYSSGLVFAGVSDWWNSGKSLSYYGNGIVTADELSRLDLRSVELVVLSSCYSGMNGVELTKGFHGMLGALSAAGVHYVISSLWSADDFGTTILMDAFYALYKEQGLPPAAALSGAKEYIRQVTIGQLREQGWFAYIRNNTSDPVCISYIERFEQLPDRVRPFRREIYWGGFHCYRCN